jgi:hypothetical protein
VELHSGGSPAPFSVSLLCQFAMSSEKPQRPAWMNWLFLGMFLWSSWQLAGYWLQRLHG